MKGDLDLGINGIIKSSTLSDNEKLYRYINLKQFISMVESKHIYLSKIANWDDTWEIPTCKIPIAFDCGELSYPKWSIEEIMYGTCWSRNKESDALWRIYSPNRDGLMIQTSVDKFNQLKEIRYGVLAPVLYYDNLLSAIEDITCRDDFISPFSNAFLKRRAFEHEDEVRLVTYNDERCLVTVKENKNFINIDVDSIEFIENIIIDPRADDWYVDTIKRYCIRAGFKFEPMKSNLYNSDVYKVAKIVMKITPVE